MKNGEDWHLGDHAAEIARRGGGFATLDVKWAGKQREGWPMQQTEVN